MRIDLAEFEEKAETSRFFSRSAKGSFSVIGSVQTRSDISSRRICDWQSVQK